MSLTVKEWKSIQENIINLLAENDITEENFFKALDCIEREWNVESDVIALYCGFVQGYILAKSEDNPMLKKMREWIDEHTV